MSLEPLSGPSGVAAFRRIPEPGETTTRTPSHRSVEDGGDFGSVSSTGRIDSSSPGSRSALDTQRQLSQARQDLGRAQRELDNRNPLRKFGDWFRGPTDVEKRVESARARIDALSKQAATQPTQLVEAARFQVFTERIASLEGEVGKSEAALLARQTYYNDSHWNDVAAHTDGASQTDLDVAGLPREPNMRTLDGKPVDAGHVAAALDWQVNDRSKYGNPFDENSITVTGDLASAAVNTPAGANVVDRARASVAREGDADWNGDLDGNNLADRLQKNPDASLAQVMSGYYGSGAYERRVPEWLGQTKFAKPDGRGGFQVDRGALGADAARFALLLKTKDPGYYFGPLWGSRPQPPATGAVVSAYVEWLKANSGGVSIS